MERSRLLERIFELLSEHQFDVLMQKQSKFCVSCGGTKIDHFYRCPISAEIGAIVDQIKIMDSR